MAVEATKEGESVLYDTTTGIAFGPLFGSYDDASDFLEWYNENHDQDIRDLTDEEQSQKMEAFSTIPLEYWETTLIVDGAVEEAKTFYDEGEIDDYVEKIKAQTKAVSTVKTELYIINHAHRESREECACAQYATDHKANYVFPQKTQFGRDSIA